MPRPLLALAWAVLGTAPLTAQSASPRYLPISSWAAPYVEHLIRAGVLTGLDPLTRPLRRDDVARALAAVDTTALAPRTLSIIHLLGTELEERSDSVRWSLEGSVGALAASDARRWPLRPSADSAGLFPAAGLTMSLEMPHLVLVTHPVADNRLKYDPDYLGKKDRFVAGRATEAYIAASWRYVDLFFGTEDRNWGSPEIEGLLFSPAPYGMDHLQLRLGPRRLRLELIATQLDNVLSNDSTQLLQRYLSLHRLVVEPSSRLTFSLSEAALYASGRTSRSFEPWYLNVLDLWLLAQADGAETANALVAADVSWLGPGQVRLFGQLYLDDFQVDRRVASDLEPPGYGFTLAASGGAAHGAISWSAIYTRVTNLAYRTPNDAERYTYRNVGIARNFSDYDQATLRAWTAAAPRLLVSGELSLVRQGEGDFRTRYPDVSQFATTPTILSGVVERTARLAAQAEWAPVRGVALSADLGRSFVSNAGHVSGRSGDRWVWRLRAEVRRRLAGTISWPD